jgi:hypothetical protein
VNMQTNRKYYELINRKKKEATMIMELSDESPKAKRTRRASAIISPADEEVEDTVMNFLNKRKREEQFFMVSPH